MILDLAVVAHHLCSFVVLQFVQKERNNERATSCCVCLRGLDPHGVDTNVFQPCLGSSGVYFFVAILALEFILALDLWNGWSVCVMRLCI